MLIECPRCRTQAQLDGSRRGAQVRCRECGTVFRTRGGETTPGGLFWGLAVAVVVGLVLVILVRRGGDPPPPEESAVAAAAPSTEQPVAPAPAESGDGWESAPVQAAVLVHEAAFGQDRAALLLLLDTPRLRETGTFATPAEALEDLLASPDPFAVRSWKPYDGHIVVGYDDVVTVRLACVPRNTAEMSAKERYAKRWFQWELARVPGSNGWAVYGWRRWISPEEERAARTRNVSVVLSDGSRVIERVAEPQEHLPDTPPELQETIDGLLSTMLDLDLTVESSRAQAKLIAIGRPAIPVLLNELYEIPLETQDDAIRCNLVVQTLRGITGQSFGFRPQLLEGSGVGTTEERRASAVRQWFAWWNMHHDDFETPPTNQGAE